MIKLLSNCLKKYGYCLGEVSNTSNCIFGVKWDNVINLYMYLLKFNALILNAFVQSCMCDIPFHWGIPAPFSQNQEPEHIQTFLEME